MKSRQWMVFAAMVLAFFALGAIEPFAPKRPINMGGNQINNVGAATSDNDAVRRVDAQNASNLASGTVALARLSGITDAQIATANKDGTTSTPSLRTLGLTSTSAAAGNHIHGWTTGTETQWNPGSQIVVSHTSDSSYNRSVSVIAATGQNDYLTLLMPFENYYSSTYEGTAFTNNGSAALSSSQVKFGTNALSLNGSAYITGPTNHTQCWIGVLPFTLDCWIRPTTVASQSTIIDFRPASTNGFYPLLYIAAGGNLVYHVNSAARITGSTAVTTNTWHHVAVVRSIGTTTLYLNGVSQGTWADSNSYLTPTIRIGANNAGTNFFTGAIDELRLEINYARWTSGFSGSLPSSATTPSYLYGEIRTASSTLGWNATFNDASTIFTNTGTYGLRDVRCRVGNLPGQ